MELPAFPINSIGHLQLSLPLLIDWYPTMWLDEGLLWSYFTTEGLGCLPKGAGSDQCTPLTLAKAVRRIRIHPSIQARP